MKLDIDQQPRHNAGCNGTPETGPCAACLWFEERVAEMHALQRFIAMVAFYPHNAYGRIGWG